MNDTESSNVDAELDRVVNCWRLTDLAVAWVAVAQLCCLLYVSEISDLHDYLIKFSTARDHYIVSMHKVNPMLLKRKG
jgi:hypothetical protein